MRAAAENPRSRFCRRAGPTCRPGPTPAWVASAAASPRFPVVLPPAAGGSRPGLASRHSAVGSFGKTWWQRLHLPAPLGSPGVTRLPRYYGCSDSCGPAATPLGMPAGLPACVHETSDHSALNHPLAAPESWSGCVLRAYRVSSPVGRCTPVPVGRSVIWASPLGCRLAAASGRIRFVILRTSRSPPVALHPASRRRSYLRLRGSDPTSAGTCTPLFRDVHRRT